METFTLKLTSEECVSIQNLLEEKQRNVGVISAMKEIEKLLEKFRNPSKN